MDVDGSLLETRAGDGYGVEAVALAVMETAREPGRSELEAGRRVSAETSGRPACDAGLVGVLRREEGEVLDVGRKRCTVSPAAA